MSDEEIAAWLDSQDVDKLLSLLGQIAKKLLETAGFDPDTIDI